MYSRIFPNIVRFTKDLKKLIEADLNPEFLTNVIKNSHKTTEYLDRMKTIYDKVQSKHDEQNKKLNGEKLDQQLQQLDLELGEFHHSATLMNGFPKVYEEFYEKSEKCSKVIKDFENAMNNFLANPQNFKIQSANPNSNSKSQKK